MEIFSHYSSKACKTFFFFWKSLHNFQKKKRFCLPYWKLFGLSIFFRFSSKACKTSFYFKKKSLHYFWKKRRFWCSGKTFRQKTLGNFSSILPYLKLFELAFFSSHSSKACYFFLKKLALFLKKRRFWCSGKTFIKKHSENFQVSAGPIWNFSYLQYFILFIKYDLL